MVYQDVGSSFSCEFRGGDSEHIRPPAETICKEKDVGISSNRDRQESKIINADGYPGTIRQWDGDCRPTDSLTRRFSRLTLEATSYPPFCANFHTDPPVEAFHILSVRVTPRWQEASVRHASMIHGLAKCGT